MNWDEKFSCDEYVYGKEPNDFLASVIDRLPPSSKVLSLCEGEGRNAVFMATKGHRVTAVDSSKVGLEKARRLAAEKGVEIETVLSDVTLYEIDKNKWDAVVSIFGHLPPKSRRKVHRSAVEGLKPFGVFILEAYSPRQLQYGTGGPKDPELLYEIEDLKEDLSGLEFEIAREVVREVREGVFHKGLGSVVQVLAFKRI
ncbi:MAG: class I SAM-dependent methyltransferase [Pyrinomonadaceae bacterium]|nr:class I SAM-dependent methyltransferase [Pyrinomonadaceae bacterium]MCX7639269.1 class I SAM-dependent methyltransferase [Pyrinomonadaceae bacterium]MDW8303509.1 class I SAM-dependent methyltransferase [Acidobacteriota bacterium]